jgi:hypothetical protein
MIRDANALNKYNISTHVREVFISYRTIDKLDPDSLIRFRRSLKDAIYRLEPITKYSIENYD